MAAITHETPAAPEEHGGHAGAHGHPSDANYWGIAAFLGAVTAGEVALTYVHLGAAVTPLLLIGMMVKFVTVAGYFMHLKFDRPVLRNLMLTGFVLAVACYVGVLFMFRDFGGKTVQIDYRQSGVPGAQVPQQR